MHAVSRTHCYDVQASKVPNPSRLPISKIFCVRQLKIDKPECTILFSLWKVRRQEKRKTNSFVRRQIAVRHLCILWCKSLVFLWRPINLAVNSDFRCMHILWVTGVRKILSFSEISTMDASQLHRHGRSWRWRWKSIKVALHLNSCPKTSICEFCWNQWTS